MSLHEILEIKKQQIISNSIITTFQNQKNKEPVLPLDSRNFDEVLGGGFNLGNKYLIFGPNNTGKTQLCHQLCVQAYKHLKNNSIQKSAKLILYLDTENTFRPERIKELIDVPEIEVDKVLGNILVSKIMSNSALILALRDFEKAIMKYRSGVLIIDTINNHFRSEIGNKNLSFSRAKEMFLSVLRIINKLTINYNLLTIATAQVASDFSKGDNIREIPVGNQFLNHFFSEYIYLSKNDKDRNYVQLVNSLHLSEKRLPYKITSRGIQDYKF
ncbi:MAG: hypothetical protein ACXAEX_11000 [Promethearchaeota archaeon]|jgi:DNA repair protein RadA